jgi:hypothetical protein
MYNLYNIYATLLYNYIIVYIEIYAVMYTQLCVCILYICTHDYTCSHSEVEIGNFGWISTHLPYCLAGYDIHP